LANDLPDLLKYQQFMIYLAIFSQFQPVWWGILVVATTIAQPIKTG